MLHLFAQGQGEDRGRPVGGEVPLDGGDLWGVGSVGEKEEVVAAHAPGRFDLVEHVGGDLAGLAVGDTPDVDRAEAVADVPVVDDAHREREVPAVGRPGVIEDPALGVVGQLDDLAARDVDDEQLAPLVAEGDPLAIRRPGRRIAHLAAVVGQLDGLAGAVLSDEEDLLLAGPVRQKRDLAAVGRPAGPLFVGPRATGQIAGRALLDRRREDVAPGDEERALALRAQTEATDAVGDLDARRALP